MKKDSMNSTST